MCRSLLVLALTASAFGAQSLTLTSGKQGSYTIPASGAYLAIGDSRIEFRLHDFTGCAGLNYIFTVGPFLVRCQTAQYLRVDDQFTGANIGLLALPTSSQDTIFRVQRSTANGLTVEMWQKDGSYSLNSTADAATVGNASGVQQIGDTATLINIAWLRWYSTTVATGGIPPSNAFGGTLGEWEFEGNLNDSSGNSMTITWASPAYVTTPVYGPVAVATVSPALSGPSQVVRAGTTVTLNGSGSYSRTDTPSLTYAWSQQSGASTLNFSSTSVASPTITGLVFGQYVIRLTVTDNLSQTAFSDLTLGSVVTDNNYVVQLGSAKLNQIFGPMIAYGHNPWNWADQNQFNMATNLGVAYGSDPNFAAQWRTYLSGTVTTTNGSVNVTGTGTTFKADFCGGTTSPVTNSMFVLYPEKVPYGVSACTDDTHLVLSSAVDVTGSGATYAAMTNVVTCYYGLCTSDNANYYDNVLAHYNLYYRTGLTQYRDNARTLAARWLDSPLFPYPRLSAPRLWALNGLMLYAWESGTTSAWALIEPWLDYAATYQSTVGVVGDVREEGYMVAFLANASQFEPNPGKAAYYASILPLAKTNRWAPSRNAGGYQTQDLCGWAWDCNFYDQLNFSANLANGSKAVTVPAESGTVTITSGSTAVVGVGTSLKTKMCRGGATPPHLGGLAAERIIAWRGDGTYAAFPVASCTDETHVTLVSAPSETLTGVQWSLSWPYWVPTLTWFPNPYTVTLTNGSTTATFASGVDTQAIMCNGTGSTTNNFFSAIQVRVDATNEMKFGYAVVASCPTTSTITMTTPWTGSTGSYQWMQPASNVWFRSNAIDVGYQMDFLDPVNAVLDKPYAGATGTSTWRYAGGTVVQPFVEGVATTAWNWATKVTADPVTRSWITQNVAYMRDQGVWQAMNAYYYFSLGPGCGSPNPAYYLWCTGGTKTGDVASIQGQRFLTGETINGFSAALLIDGSTVTKSTMNTLYSACLGRPGYGGNLDANFCAELLNVEAGTKPKDFGFFYGMGNAASWPAALVSAIGNFKSIGFSGNVTVKGDVKIQ